MANPYDLIQDQSLVFINRVTSYFTAIPILASVNRVPNSLFETVDAKAVCLTDGFDLGSELSWDTLISMYSSLKF